MAVAVVVALLPLLIKHHWRMTPRAEYVVGKLSWRKHSSDPTLFFISVYDITKHVGNVGFRGYI